MSYKLLKKMSRGLVSNLIIPILNQLMNPMAAGRNSSSDCALNMQDREPRSEEELLRPGFRKSGRNGQLSEFRVTSAREALRHMPVDLDVRLLNSELRAAHGTR